ncbi:MAG: carbohydrate kinase family protein [Halanaerobiales bacterium]
MDIVVAGHICLDIIPDWKKGNIDSIKPGHIVEMSGIDFSTGGAVANTGLTLHKLGIEPGLLGKIGNDQFGKIIIDYLKSQTSDDISSQMIISEDETTSYTIVLTPPDTDRVFLHYPGTNNTFSSRDIDYNKLNSAKLFHFGYPPLMRKIYQEDGRELKKIFKKIQEKGLLTSLDMAVPDPNTEAGALDWKSFLKNILPYVDIFMPSIDEVLYMLDSPEANEIELDLNFLDSISNELVKWGSKIVVIKLGSQGLYMKSGNLTELNERDRSRLDTLIPTLKWNEQELLSPCYDVEVVGTTGSGDATIAGFLAGILHGKSPEETLNLATAVGACSVEAVNATAGIIPLEELYTRLKIGWDRLPIELDLQGWTFIQDSGVYSKKRS